MIRRRKNGYFKPEPGAPPPLVTRLARRVAFSEVDVMAVTWHGRYAEYFEEASTKLRRKCGLTYERFRDSNLRAPVVQFHVDYHCSVYLDELITAQASLIWTEAARLNIEYEIHKENGQIAATGYTVQMFTDGVTGEPWLTSPQLLEQCRERWRELVS